MKTGTKFKSVDELICKTTSKTFQAYWREQRRHEKSLRAIFAKDKHHQCVPVEVGSISCVHPKKRTILMLCRCAICMKDLNSPPTSKTRYF